jgi:hypothetical protein
MDHQALQKRMEVTREAPFFLIVDGQGRAVCAILNRF